MNGKAGRGYGVQVDLLRDNVLQCSTGRCNLRSDC